MAKHSPKSYSKFTYEDIKALGLKTVVVDLFEGIDIPPLPVSARLKEILDDAKDISLDTEKARSEFIIAPILRELQKNNKTVFSVFSGFQLKVDEKKGLQGFCDFLLAKLPRNVVPDTPIIAVVEAKLNDVITAAVPKCVAEMYATRLWNEKYQQPQKAIFGIITTGNLWLFLRMKEGEMTIDIDNTQYSLLQVDNLLGVLQFVVDQFRG